VKAIAPQLGDAVTEGSFGLLRSNMDAATSTLADIFASSFRKRFGDFELDEVEVNLKVSADGRLGLMGTRVSIKGGGSVKLRFLRRKRSSEGVTSPCLRALLFT